MRLAFDYAAMSHVGLVRANNEDSAYASPRLLLLADGMGGMAGGEVASALTIGVARQLDHPARGDLVVRLADVANAAQECIRATVAADRSLTGMGTTLVAVLVDGARVGLLHVGDSRAYRLRGTQLTRLTVDHTLVQLLVDSGRLSESGARTHPHRSMIVRAINGGPDDEADVTVLDVAVGDRLLICSDGLSDYVPDEQIADVLAGKPPEKAVFDLVTAGLDGQSRDNVTCVVADVVAARLRPRDRPHVPVLVGAAAGKIRVPWASAAQAPLPLLRAAVAHLQRADDEPPFPTPFPTPTRRRRSPALSAVRGLLILLVASAAATVVSWWWPGR